MSILVAVIYALAKRRWIGAAGAEALAAPLLFSRHLFRTQTADCSSGATRAPRIEAMAGFTSALGIRQSVL
jgi:hypothetical protein